MGRIRAMRPDFFMDEETAVLHPDAQLLLLGLATLADRDGRLEDRPVRIKACLFPYRDVDVAAHLRKLEEAGQVVRYEADGVRCIFLVHFGRDQKPHPKETSYGLPSPPVKRREVSRQDPEPSRRAPMVVGCGSGNGSLSAAVAADAGECEELPDATDDAERPALVLAPSEPDRQPEKPVRVPKAEGPDPEALRALWNRLAAPKGLQRWEAMSKKRAGDARASLLAVPDLGKWEAWLAYELSRPWNLGQNDSGWRADVDWLLRAKTRDLVADFNPATAPKTPASAPPKPTKFIEM